MIRYTLRCEADHSFDSWFQSADAFERLQAAGHVACAICGSVRVEKALMAPAVVSPRKDPRPGTGPAAAPADAARGGALATPQTEIEAALARLRAAVETHSNYVGDQFAAQARAMHLGDLPERPIHGEARPDEARALLEDGVPVVPLPFLSTRKTN